MVWYGSKALGALYAKMVLLLHPVAVEACFEEFMRIFDDMRGPRGRRASSKCSDLHIGEGGDIVVFKGSGSSVCGNSAPAAVESMF